MQIFFLGKLLDVVLGDIISALKSSGWKLLIGFQSLGTHSKLVLYLSFIASFVIGGAYIYYIDLDALSTLFKSVYSIYKYFLECVVMFLTDSYLNYTEDIRKEEYVLVDKILLREYINKCHTAFLDNMERELLPKAVYPDDWPYTRVYTPEEVSSPQSFSKDRINNLSWDCDEIALCLGSVVVVIGAIVLIGLFKS